MVNLVQERKPQLRLDSGQYRSDVPARPCPPHIRARDLSPCSEDCLGGGMVASDLAFCIPRNNWLSTFAVVLSLAFLVMPAVDIDVEVIKRHQPPPPNGAKER